jgi:hypothetical protein
MLELWPGYDMARSVFHVLKIKGFSVHRGRLVAALQYVTQRSTDSDIQRADYGNAHFIPIHSSTHPLIRNNIMCNACRTF